MIFNIKDEINDGVSKNDYNKIIDDIMTKKDEELSTLKTSLEKEMSFELAIKNHEIEVVNEKLNHSQKDIKNIYEKLYNLLSEYNIENIKNNQNIQNNQNIVSVIMEIIDKLVKKIEELKKGIL